MANYVKFMRGTPKAFSQLAVKDIDTLYFIAEKDATSGRLYLGNKELICDNHEASVTFLRDLLDVNLPENIGELIDGQVLTYDVASESWVARTPSAVAEVKFDNNQFVTNAKGELSLINFENAPSGAQLTKSADGSLIWVLPDAETVEGLSELVTVLREDVDNLTTKFNDYDTSAEVDAKISSAVAGISHLSYKIVNSTDEINVGADDADKYIYLVKNGNSYDEYMVVNGQLERVGDWNVDLSDYATKSEVAAVSTRVDDIASQLNGVKSDVSTHTTAITNINTSIEDLASSLGSVNSSITDLASQLNAVKETVNTHSTKLNELEDALEGKVDVSVFNTKMAIVDEDISELKDAMTWNELKEQE